MIKREFVENNIVKILSYLPYKIHIKNNNYYLFITKTSTNCWIITYENEDGGNLFTNAFTTDFVENLIYIIEKIDKIIPDFINNLIDL